MKGLNYYKGEITYSNGETVEEMFNFINILNTDFVCIDQGNDLYEYVKLECVYKISIKGGLEIEQEINED